MSDSRKVKAPGPQKTRREQIHYSCSNHAGHSEIVNWVADREDPNGHKCPRCGS